MKLPQKRYIILPEVDGAGARIWGLYELMPMRVNEALKFGFRRCACNASRDVLVLAIAHIHGIEEPIAGWEYSEEPQFTIEMMPTSGSIPPQVVN